MATSDAAVDVYAEPRRIRQRATSKERAIEQREAKQPRQVLHSIETVAHKTGNEKAPTMTTEIDDGDGYENLAFHTYVMYRCNRWGKFERWRSRRGVTDPVPRDIFSWWGPAVLEGNVEQTGLGSLHDICPVDLEEAVETRLCVQALPAALSETVWHEHVRAGKTQREKAALLGIKPRTFRYRLAVAYPMLLGFFNDVSAGLKPGGNTDWEREYRKASGDHG